MSWQLATLAAILLGFAAISSRAEGTSLTAPMVFTAAGLIVGVDALGLVDPSATGEGVKLLAEATLAAVLFADASRIDLPALQREVVVPARLLGIGLPLTILAGFLVALLLLDDLAWPEALLLAIILAPTDAALGQAVVTFRRLPSVVRQSLNVESGLNDGICVPLFLIALAVAQIEETPLGSGHAGRIVAEEIGYGVLGGVVAGMVGAAVLVVAGGKGLISAPWRQVVPLASAALAYGLADAVGGSGFIAAFVGGGVFGAAQRRRGHETGYLIEQAGDVLGAVTFVVFGAVLLGPAIGDATWQIVVYAVLSLTAVRMIPVGVALLGAGYRPPAVAFMGWFGPRGLASIVFALLLLEEGGLPGDNLIVTTAVVAVGLSVLAHGVSAAPVSRRYASWLESQSPRGRPPGEERETVGLPWRARTSDGRP